MGIPNKALRVGSFKYLDGDEVVNDCSHHISRVSFTEVVGDLEFIRTGFFKRVEPKGSYPELLAKISVAISSFKQSFLGKRTAEERLVFNEHDDLVGSFSFTLEGFQPFNFAHEKVPEDPLEREKVLPSTQTLLETNYMELLVAHILMRNDDPHNHNESLVGGIDNDMGLYPITKYMKSERLFVSSDDESSYITASDYASFPVIKDFRPFHWPTYRVPGENSLPGVLQNSLVAAAMRKVNADPQSFINLASEPRAQDQKLAAVLKVLLTFQPEVQRQRLIELFGEIPLNYTSLDEKDPALRKKYETLFPQLFNNKTNKESTVDFVMKLYQSRYDDLYRVFVSFTGCANNGAGLELPATSTSLYKRPSFYKNILAWVENENNTRYAHDEKIQYNLTVFKNRYHQVWRDAFSQRFKELVSEANVLTRDVLNLATDISVKIDLEPVLGKDAADASLNNSGDFFDNLNNISVNESLICLADDSQIRTALSTLTIFTNKLNELSKSYYTKTYQELRDEDNGNFCKNINDWLRLYGYEITANLAHTSTYASRFAALYEELTEFTVQVDFHMHWYSDDEHMLKKRDVYVRKELLPHMHPEVMQQFNENLFLWANSLASDAFNECIVDIIDKKYTPTAAFSMFSMRQRTQPVKEYLRTSKETNANKLAHILSSGREDGALNTLLLQSLAPLMLQYHPLPSISLALKSGQFALDAGAILKLTIAFAKKDKQFTHLYSDAGIEQFYKTFYYWISCNEHADDIQKIKDAAIKQYEAGISFGRWYNTRKAEVNGYFMAHQAEKATALTFNKGNSTSTLSLYLFLKIIKVIKKNIQGDPELKKLSGYQLIDQFSTCDEATPDAEQLFFMSEIREHKVTETMLKLQASSEKPEKPSLLCA